MTNRETRQEVMPSGKVWTAVKQPNGHWYLDVEMTEAEWQEYCEYKKRNCLKLTEVKP